jgi:uncharacterized protein (DUF2235 family)
MVKKRLVFCFDGTWNELKAGSVTNVGLTAQCIASQSRDGTQQIVWYDEGVGTSAYGTKGVVRAIEKWGGGLFGHGLLANLVEAYRFLVFNYEPDDEIYIFGFSRGAFSARSFAGLLRACGAMGRADVEHIPKAMLQYKALKPNDAATIEALRRFRWEYSPRVCVDEEEDDWRCKAFPKEYAKGQSPLFGVTYLGVWDTVGSLGVPFGFSNKYQFHDTNLSRFVGRARHAVAIDERRRSFNATLWTNLEEINRAAGYKKGDPAAPYQEMWFPGVHGAVGGGTTVRGLSDEALHWILRGAQERGLAIETGKAAEIYRLTSNPYAHLDNKDPLQKPSIQSLVMDNLPAKDRDPGPRGLHEVSISARLRYAADPQDLDPPGPYEPGPLKPLDEEIRGWIAAEVAPVTELTRRAPEMKGEYGGPHKKWRVVSNGDTLSRIALQYYQHADYYKALFLVNRPPLTDPDIIYDGQKLWIPPRELLELVNKLNINVKSAWKAA